MPSFDQEMAQHDLSYSQARVLEELGHEITEVTAAIASELSDKKGPVNPLTDTYTVVLTGAELDLLRTIIKSYTSAPAVSFARQVVLLIRLAVVDKEENGGEVMKQEFITDHEEALAEEKKRVTWTSSLLDAIRSARPS